MDKKKSPKHGWGRFGTIEWHENVIKSINDSYGIVRYVKAVTNEDLYNVNNVSKMRKAAIRMIKKYLGKKNGS